MNDANRSAKDAVVTSRTYDASPEEVWNALLLFEQVRTRPSWPLRLLLPEPIGIEGPHSRPGDEARCLYRNGSLVKRVTESRFANRYAFDVVEQDLRLGGLRLRGGSYELSPSPQKGTQVRVETRYDGGRSPRWLWRVLERVVGHRFHHLLLRDLELRLRSRRREPSRTGRLVADARSS